jgi:hypothetical protein
MSELVFDPIEIAKTYQWEIESLEDPADAAIQGSRALRTLEEMRNEVFKEGRSIHVHALGADVLKYWLDEEQRHITLHFGDVLASGKSGGLSFVQNLGNPRLQTIFLAVRESEIMERQFGEEELITSPLAAPTLVVPILGLESIELAA